MAEWISANLSTVIVCAAVLFMIAAAVTVIRKNRKNGRFSCGGSCGGCPMSGSCHKEKPKT